MCPVPVDQLDFDKWPLLQPVDRKLLDDAVLFRVFEDEFSNEGQQYVFVLKNEDVYWFKFRNKYLNNNGDDPHRLVKIDRLCNQQIVGLSGSGSLLICLSKRGQVFVYGTGDHGELGLGIQIRDANFDPITSLTSISRISSSGSHTIALSTSGLVYCWGSNFNGECGHDAQEFWFGLHEPSPVDGLPPDDPPVDVTASRNCCFVLTSSGKVFGFGENTDGELGIGRSDEAVWTPTQVVLPERVTKVRCTTFTSLGLGRSGRLYIWGLIQSEVVNLAFDPPLPTGSSAIFTPAAVLSIDRVLDIASAMLGDMFAISTERGIFKLSVEERTELVEDKRAMNMAEVFAGSLTPTIVIDRSNEVS